MASDHQYAERINYRRLRRPATIASSEIEGIWRMVESRLRVEPHPSLKSRNFVRVKYGPVAAAEGILLRKEIMSRLVLSLEMLGKIRRCGS